MKLQMFFSGYLSGKSHSHICCELAKTLAGPELGVSLFAPTGMPRLTEDSHAKWLYSKLKSRFMYKLAGDRAVRRFAERKYLSHVNSGDIAYPWSAYSRYLPEKLASRGALVVVEMINSHIQFAADVLRPEYDRLGLPLPERFEVKLANERERLKAADLVFSPSPLVTQSLITNGVPTEKIADSSYGFRPERLVTPDEIQTACPAELTFLFVGLLCIRKGVHRLLEYWQRSQLPKARLVLVGRISDELPESVRKLLNQDSVRWVHFTENIAEIYAQADVFVFPSFEEAGPLVTYEAMASGLPCLVSPAGAGRVLRDGVDGYVEDPTEIDAWISRMHQLAEDEELRHQIGQSAIQRAKQFTWDRVGAARRGLLLDRYNEWNKVA